MSVVANIAVNVDSTKAVSQLQAVDRAATGLSGNTGKLQQAFGGLNTALAGLGLGALIKDLAGAGIDADRTGKRIQSLAGSSGEAGKVLDIASKAAKDFGLSNLEAQKGVADLYGRLRPAGVALKDIETVYNGVNKAALAAGLTNADTSGVFLQLSQALGSGALQGDELRSIMEQMPAVGQAVAKVMGVTVGEVKKLGSEGKITTDVMIKAAAELNKLAPPPPDPFKQFNAALTDLRVELGENILPILTPFLQLLLGVVKAFGAMPEPLQTVIVALGLAATAIIAIGTAAAVLAPVIAGFKTFAALIGAANIGGIIAGWLPVIVSGLAGIVGAVKAVGALILAVFSGPVGWTVLAVAAVVAMAIAFRRPLGDFANWLWNWGKPIREFWVGLWNGVVTNATKSFEVLRSAMVKVADFVKGIWTGMINSAKSVIRGLLQMIANNINAVGAQVNRLIGAFNRLPGPDIPFVPKLSVPAFAKGGVVSGPTLALVGEAGPEYIIPADKMAAASTNYLSGARGNDVIPAFADGGYVGYQDRPLSSRMVRQGNDQSIDGLRSNVSRASYLQNLPDKTEINIQTGPVMEMNGERYVSMEDFERGLRQVAGSVYKGLRTPAGRYATGVR